MAFLSIPPAVRPHPFQGPFRTSFQAALNFGGRATTAYSFRPLPMWAFLTRGIFQQKGGAPQNYIPPPPREIESASLATRTPLENGVDEEHIVHAWEHWRSLGAPRYVMAPMVDGSELAFRTLSRRYGTELAYSPMLHSRMFNASEKFRSEMFTTSEVDRPVVAQFCANDPELFVQAATHVQDRVDAIDLNLGCPQGIARKGRYGSFLQDDWDLLERLVSTAARELKVPIWCKIRIFDDRAKTVAYAQMLEKAGASLIAVHGRTREQKGKNAPPADWDSIKAVKEAVRVPVIANGNVRSREDADEAMRYTGADAVMAAWALLDNPAVFNDNGNHPSRLELLREYLDLAEKLKTPMRMVRLHVFKLLRSRLDVNMDLNETTAKCRNIEHFRELANIIEARTDQDISFEERQRTGQVVVNKICPRKKRKTANGSVVIEEGEQEEIKQVASVPEEASPVANGSKKAPAVNKLAFIASES